MDIKRNIMDIRLRLDALELLLIARGETNRENLDIFRKEAEQTYSVARDQFRRKQWAKIKVGEVVNYELTPTSSLDLEVIAISEEPFHYLAGKVLKKNGKSGYRVGETFSCRPWKVMLKGLSNEIISMEVG